MTLKGGLREDWRNLLKQRKKESPIEKQTGILQSLLGLGMIFLGLTLLIIVIVFVFFMFKLGLILIS